jgi:hypothetical protein
MDLVAEFRRHADISRRTARQTKDPAARAQWEVLAERWERCVETAENAITAAANATDVRSRAPRPLPRRWYGS